MRLPDIVTQYPVSLIFVCLAAGIIVAMALYYRELRSEISLRIRWISAIIRAIVYSAVAFLLLQPLIQSFVKEREKPVIAVMIDNSQSIKMSSKGGVAWMDELRGTLNDLGSGYDLRYYRFDSSVEEDDSVDFSGYRTDIGQALTYVGNVLRNRNLGAVVLATDGIFNAGRDPLQSALSLQVPIYSLALGDTQQYADVRIAGIESNRIAFLGNTFPVRIHIRAQKAAGASVRLEVRRDGVMLHSEVIRVNDDDYYTMKEPRFEARHPGLNKYVVSVSSLDNELNLSNNRQSVYIEVLDSRHKVLILAASPHPDITALRQSFASRQQVEVDVVMLPNANINLQAYDMVVLYQLPNLRQGAQSIIAALREKSIPVLFCLGSQSDIRSFDALNTGLRIAGSVNKYNDVFTGLNPRFTLFRANEKAVNLLGDLDPLLVPFGEFNTAPDMHTFLFQRIGKVSTDKPLFSFHEQMGWRSAYLSGEGIWRWRSGMFRHTGSHEWFNDLFASVIQYLAVAEKKGRFRIELPVTLPQSEPVVVRAELYNASYQPETGKEISFELKDSIGNRFNYSFGNEGTSYSLNLGYLQPGKYTYRAQAKDVSGVAPISGIFEVEEVNIESTVLQANHALLASLASLRDGKLVTMDSIDQLSKLIKDREDIRPLVFTHKRYTDLTRWPWYLLALLLLLTAEWVIRRASGAY